MEDIVESLFDIIGGVLAEHVGASWFIDVATVVGIIRIFIKPIMSLLVAYTMVTETNSDNEFLNKVMASKIYKWVVYFFDWFGSIKLPKK